MGRYERLPRRERVTTTPEPVEGEPGLFRVDATWGRIWPIEAAPGVRTVGELEVIAHLEAGLLAVDTRRPHYVAAGTIPGAIAIDHRETLDHLDRLDPATPTVFFCNGPQCAATPDTIRQLLASGFPASSILYYRGGIHDWVTLGLPLEPGPQRASTPAA